MMKYIIGIDPGKTGAIAMINAQGEYVQVYDMPTDELGYWDLKEELRCEIGPGWLAALWVEENYARRGNSAGSTHTSGMQQGMCRLWAASWKIPWHLVLARVWKKEMGLIKKDKEDSRLLGRKTWPNAPLKWKKDHDRAEALLIAEYGRLRTKI